MKISFSIHALLAESDSCLGRHQERLTVIFLSTLSLRRATWWSVDVPGWILGFSIHALLAESDTIFAVRPYDAPIFLSTLSLRRATPLLVIRFPIPRFLSTLSLRRATIVSGAGNNPIRFSIHALLAESDLSTLIIGFSAGVFLSTLSLRRATGY